MRLGLEGTRLTERAVRPIPVAERKVGMKASISHALIFRQSFDIVSQHFRHTNKVWFRIYN